MMNLLQPWVVLTADPDFQDEAVEELRAASATRAAVEPLADGMFISNEVDFFSLAATWVANPPIFVRHICPAMATLPLSHEARDLAALQRLVDDKLASLVEPLLSFSVQTRIVGDSPLKPFDVNNALSRIIQQRTGAELDVRNPAQVLSVVVAPWTDRASPSAFLGLSLSAQNLSSWAGGKRRFRREPAQVSRAEFKLLEAFEVFGIELPPRGVALDLGASPGGWTRVLRQHGQYVTAVDPGELDPRLATDSGIRHLHTTAEAYLVDEPDRFDLIVNDMRMDVLDSARLMVAYAGQLYAHGSAIMTLKLPAQARGHLLASSFDILGRAYEIAGARQLFHNRSEVTVYLKKQAPSIEIGVNPL